MAAVRPQANTRTGPTHFSGRNVFADMESRRSPDAARPAPRKATHSVSCCTKTTEPGIPAAPARRVTMAMRGNKANKEKKGEKKKYSLFSPTPPHTRRPPGVSPWRCTATAPSGKWLQSTVLFPHPRGRARRASLGFAFAFGGARALGAIRRAAPGGARGVGLRQGLGGMLDPIF